MCHQRHLGRHHFRCMTPCRSMRLVRDRSKSSPCNRPTLRSTARAPHFCRSGRLLRRRSLWRYGVPPVSSAESGPTSFLMRSPNVDRLGVSAIGRSPIGRLCGPPLGRHTIVAQNVCYVDIQAVWRVLRVVSGIRADTAFDEQPHVDRRGFPEIERSPFRESDDYAFCRSGATLFRAGRLLHSGGVARLPCRQRHLG